jgi:hypothetical protein
MRRRISGAVLTVTGILACPCHLIVTLPLLAAFLAGTALGSFLLHNAGLVYIGAGIYFVVALALGVRFLLGSSHAPRNVQAKNACPSCSPVETTIPRQEQSSLHESLPAHRK